MLSELRSSRGIAAALVTFGAFIDLVAYSIAVPVLPDLSQRLGATPTTVGLLFASFGLTVLVAAVPMGAISDRLGRRVPLIAGSIILGVASALFAYADQIWLLFAARMIQGVGDAMTWVVGFALIADLYDPTERGRAMGMVMSGTSFGLMVGPTIGGWLYEAGGVHVPFLAVAAASFGVAVLFAWVELPASQERSERVPIALLMRDRVVVI
ncbi:MAG: MFS transporter, partial [Vicinamibacterales bacterium]